MEIDREVAISYTISKDAAHVSSRPASRSCAASRVVRRKTNRRHMTGDHRVGTARRATLLVRAMDEILGTHSVHAARHEARSIYDGHQSSLPLARC
jgi:hypothetical protein